MHKGSESGLCGVLSIGFFSFCYKGSGENCTIHTRDVNERATYCIEYINCFP
jgi:hypothetical protein